MIKPEQIQDEAAEAAAKAAWELDRKSSGRSDFPLWEDLHPGVRHIQIERHRAAIVAAINVWPRMQIHTDGTEDWIELTLMQENNDDKG